MCDCQREVVYNANRLGERRPNTIIRDAEGDMSILDEWGRWCAIRGLAKWEHEWLAYPVTVIYEPPEKEQS